MKETRRPVRLIRLCSRWQHVLRIIWSIWIFRAKLSPWHKANTTSPSVTARSPPLWQRFTMLCYFMLSLLKRACRKNRVRSIWMVVIWPEECGEKVSRVSFRSFLLYCYLHFRKLVYQSFELTRKWCRKKLENFSDHGRISHRKILYIVKRIVSLKLIYLCI